MSTFPFLDPMEPKLLFDEKPIAELEQDEQDLDYASQPDGLYVADGGNNTIRKITPEGVVSTLIRVPGYPTGVAYDRARKRLFVAVDSAIYVVTF